MSEAKEKGKIAAVGAAIIALVGIKGGALLAKGGVGLVDDAAKGAAHLAPMADGAAKGAAAMGHAPVDAMQVADDAGKAAASLGEHGSGLVDDGGKYIKKPPSAAMSDSERIARAAEGVLRGEARRRRATDDE
jgi:hypothetical protein